MADHDIDIIIRAKGALQAARDIGKVDSSIGKLASTASRGARTAVTNVAKIGVVAGAGIALAVRSGLDSLAELESATTSVDGAIAQMGLAGRVTSTQIATWANDIEANIGAAFDDKEIVAATAGLIRYGKVGPDNLRPAMVVMTDLAARIGSVSGAGEILTKALADPTKAAGKLSRYGIILTKTQQDQIKAMVKTGDVAGAQALLLDELAKSTTGAAAASQGPYARSLSVLKDVTEDAQKALAIGFLPVIEKVANLLSSELAKPSTLANIREFGEGLAKGLDSLVTIAKNLPWATIGTSLRIAGEGARTVLGIFSSMPPWVQTAVLTGWGLNKLTGGALGSIVGQLASGLIKGVLGMTAGVVNINAGVVNGPGGVPGVTPTGGGGLLNTAKNLVVPVAIASVAVAAAGALANAIDPTATAPGATTLGNRDPRRFNEFGQVVRNSIAPPLKTIAANTGLITDKDQQALERQEKTYTAVETMRGRIADELGATTGAVKDSGAFVGAAASVAGTTAASASLMAGYGVQAAIRANRSTTLVSVNISATNVDKVSTKTERSGASGGDREKGGAFGGH